MAAPGSVLVLSPTPFSGRSAHRVSGDGAGLLALAPAPGFPTAAGLFASLAWSLGWPVLPAHRPAVWRVGAELPLFAPAPV